MNFAYIKLDNKNINKLQDSKADYEQLEVYIMASHTDLPINLRIYKPKEFINQLDTWTNPYKKPILLHHDQFKDPVGRIVEQQYITREQWNMIRHVIDAGEYPFPEEQSGQILLRGYIVDSAAVQKIVNGLYTTVSIGFDQEWLECSYCGADIRECDHQPGDEINGETVYSIPHSIRFREVSFVNQPADDYAGIVKVSPVKAEDAIKAIGNINVVEEEETNQELTVVSNSKDEDVGKTKNKNSDNQKDSNTESDIRRVKQMDELKEAINQLKDQIAELKDSIAVVKQEKETIEDKYNKLYEELKDMYLEKVVALKLILAGDISDKEADELSKKIKEEYKDTSIEELKLLERELNDLVNKLFDSECAECEDDEESETEEEVNSNNEETDSTEKEEAKDTEEKDKNEDAENQDDKNNDAEDSQQKMEKPEKPLHFQFKDQHEAVRSFLGIKK